MIPGLPGRIQGREGKIHPGQQGTDNLPLSITVHADLIVPSESQFLFAAEVLFRRLNRDVAE